MSSGILRNAWNLSAFREMPKCDAPNILVCLLSLYNKQDLLTSVATFV